MPFDPTKTLTAADLRPGDTVRPVLGPPGEERLQENAWSDCLVKRVDEGQVHLFRPYGTLANDMVYSGHSVICLIGVEQYQVSTASSTRWHLLHRLVAR